MLNMHQGNTDLPGESHVLTQTGYKMQKGKYL